MIKMRTGVVIGLVVAIFLSCEEKKSPDKPKEESTASVSNDSPAVSRKTIVFFGNSITAGYGLDMTEAFPARIQEKLDSMNIPYQVVNAGVSGETSAGGNSRIDWILKQ